MAALDPDELARKIVEATLIDAKRLARQIDAELEHLVTIAILARVEHRLVEAHREYGRQVRADGTTWLDIAKAAGLETTGSAESRYDPKTRKRGRPTPPGRPRGRGTAAKSVLTETPWWAAGADTLKSGNKAKPESSD